MSTSDVTTGGLEGVRPGRDALTGVNTGEPIDRGASGDRRRRKGADQPEFTSYYGRPIIKAPVWEPLDIAGYLFLGGLAGASSVLGAGATFTSRPGLARAAKATAAVAAGTSLVALVHDLGRPARFVNMLRVFKPTSPMNVGSWLLSVYAPAAFAAAGSEVLGIAPGIGTLATVAAAVTGPAVASYTAVLIADTAVPAWHDAHRDLPFVFVSSGGSAAGGVGMALSPLAQSRPARTLAAGAGLTELIMSRRMRRRMGLAAETFEQGRAGRLIKVAEALTAAGVVGAVVGRRSRAVSAVAGASLAAGSACTRFAIFEAGMASARDPRYTVVPQRARADG